MKAVVSLGGSVIVPDKVNMEFLLEFKKIVLDYTKRGNGVIIICGGGKLARSLQETTSKLKGIKDMHLDWAGIYATRVNAHILKKIFNLKKGIITNPNKKITSGEKVLIAAGWKPGFSTDYDSVLLAKNIGADEIINITNVDYVYDKDPKLKDAKPIKETTWRELRKIVGHEWKPGLNMPFDPIAAREAEKSGLKVIVIGKDLDNLKRVLSGEEFIGTLIK